MIVLHSFTSSLPVALLNSVCNPLPNPKSAKANKAKKDVMVAHNPYNSVPKYPIVIFIVIRGIAELITFDKTAHNAESTIRISLSRALPTSVVPSFSLPIRLSFISIIKSNNK